MRKFCIAFLIMTLSIGAQAGTGFDKERTYLSSLIVACHASLERYRNGIYRYPEDDGCNQEIARYFELDSQDRTPGMAVNVANLSWFRILAARAGIDVKDGRPITNNLEDPFGEMHSAIEIIASRLRH